VSSSVGPSRATTVISRSSGSAHKVVRVGLLRAELYRRGIVPSWSWLAQWARAEP
jgi:hypothetical protein